jgi:hypothetical protein
MRTLDINVQDGMGPIDIAVRQENFTRLRDYLKDCEKVFAERDEALEELAEQAAQIKSLQATLGKIDATNGNNDIAIRIRLAKLLLELQQENQILIEELKEARAESSRFGMGA